MLEPCKRHVDGNMILESSGQWGAIAQHIRVCSTIMASFFKFKGETIIKNQKYNAIICTTSALSNNAEKQVSQDWGGP